MLGYDRCAAAEYNLPRLTPAPLGGRPETRLFSRRFVALIFAPSLPAPGAEPDPDKDPQAIIRRAIKAHGGASKLARTRIMRETVRGTLLVRDTKVPFTSETLVRMPDQFRNVLTSE